MFTYVYIDIYIYLIWLWYTLLYLYMCTHVIYFLPSPSSEDFWTSLKSLCQSSPLDLPISALIQATVPSGGLGLPERVAGTGMKQLPWGLTSSYWKILWMSHHPFLSMNFFLWFSHHLFLMLPNNTTKRQMSSCSVPFLCFLGCLANKKCGSWNPRTETDRKQLRSTRSWEPFGLPIFHAASCTQGQQHRMEAVFSCRTLRASGKCACLSLVQSWWALNENASQSPWCLESNVSWLWCQLKIWTLDSLLQPLGAKNLKRQEVALLCWPAVGRICRLDAVSKWEGESHPSPQKVSRPHRELHCTFPFAVDKMHWKKIEKWDFQIICIAGRQVFWTCLEGEASSKPGFKTKEVHGTTFPQRFAVPFVGLVVKSA